MLTDPNFIKVITDTAFYKFASDALLASNYLTKDQTKIVEITGTISINNKTGKISYKIDPVHPKATQVSTYFAPRRDIAGITELDFHTHPFNGGKPSLDADVSTARQRQRLSIVATYKGAIYGYDKNGCRC